MTLEWRPLWEELKPWILPSEVASHQSSGKRSTKQILKLCSHANTYFDPSSRREMLEEFLPYFSTNDLPNAYMVFGVINIILPSHPAPVSDHDSQPRHFFPTLFHLWSIMNRSKVFDTFAVDLFSRFARDHLHCTHVPFTEYGIFSKEQSDLLFTAVLRMTGIPVSHSSSPYTSIDYMSGVGVFLEKDKKRHPAAYMVSRLIVNSLSPIGLDKEESAMASLEGLIESIDTFFHPSNQGAWSTTLSQLVQYLTDGFISRWNREQSGELELPEDRKISDALKKRFVLSLREVTFMGLFSKSGRVSHYFYSALQGLAYLEPDLILPGALQRFYPSLQGLVEVHRTTSSLNGLQMIANVISKHKGYRCHLTALLALALPGIDANDLSKTQDTLGFIQSVAYSIPMVPLTQEGTHIHDTTLAMQWVQAEMDRMERDGQDVKINYNEELTDEDEANILRSSTAGFSEFIVTLLGKVFTLIENLPDANTTRGGTPEDTVISALPAAFSPIFTSLSPDLFDLALDKLATFVSSHVIHQARDAMAWIINTLCKVNPKKTLKVFIPMFVINIRNEIEQNNAASDRTTGADYLPRDRALVWHISMLAMTVVHVGHEVLNYKDELLGIAEFMLKRCKGLPTILVSNYIHHLLLNLTQTYPLDHALYEPDVISRGVDVGDWGKTTSPAELTIRWHQPSPAEIEFAIELFEVNTRSAVKQLELLMGDDPPVKRTGKNKEWSDEASRQLQQIRLITSGIAALFDPKRAAGLQTQDGGVDPEAMEIDNDGDEEIENDEEQALAEAADDEELRAGFRSKAGYILKPSDEAYQRIHDVRDETGHVLSKFHAFLCNNMEDDVTCFTSLYSAYRTWITDVGVERSAHPLERQTRMYKADIAPFKIKGLRKVYPRPLLIKRAEAYQLLRMRHNASGRQKSELDKQLLLDLAQSSLSPYADVRRVAQSSQDSALKALIGGKQLIVPVILDGLRTALQKVDHDRIKGALYSLFYTSLLKTVIKDWRFAPEAMHLYIKTAGIDKPSIQSVGSTALYSIMDFGKPVEQQIILDDAMVDTIKPQEDVLPAINKRHAFIMQRRRKVEEAKAKLGLELTQQAKGAHWKIASRCAVFATNLCLRFQSVAPTEFVELVTQGTIDPHPGLRSYYLNALTTLFATIDVRAAYGHNLRNYYLGKETSDRNRVQIPVEKGDAAFTEKFLDSFNDPDTAEYMVDSDHPGWLVWGKKFTAFRAKPLPFDAYDETENAIREQIGQILTKDWFAKAFEYLKQEPRDSSADRFRMANVYFLMHVFDLMHYKKTAATLDDIKDLTAELYGDGNDRHQHRATAEILGALLAGSSDDPPEIRNRVWEYAAPMFLRILSDTLTPENINYWLTSIHMILDAKDPRRSHEIVDALRDFKLDMTSNAAFKESAKVQMLEFIIADGSWHFRKVDPILKDFLSHLDHPYKAVREAMGRVLSIIYKTRYHESFESVPKLLAANEAGSSIGLRPYQPSEELTATITKVFKQLEQWRQEREPGQQTPSSYTSASKTVLMWLDCTLSSHECTQLVPFFSEYFVEQLLHMMDVKEDPELITIAYHVYRQLPNIPLREGEDAKFIDEHIRIGKSATSWHQRLRALVNMQVLYFRRLFLTKKLQRDQLFTAVSDMLSDPQIEVRTAASTTLAGMIRCSPKTIRDPMIQGLKKRFERELKKNPMPKRNNPGTDTPVNSSQQITRRHAAVLGLGALVEAFPYATPPPEWMPEVLALLARRAAGDRGTVGKATKMILSEFKKTRQDSWTVDQKVRPIFPDTYGT